MTSAPINALIDSQNNDSDGGDDDDDDDDDNDDDDNHCNNIFCMPFLKYTHTAFPRN